MRLKIQVIYEIVTKNNSIDFFEYKYRKLFSQN